MTAGDHDRVVVAAVDGVQRDAGEVEGVEQVGVAQLGGEADPEEVEGAHRPVAVDGELRDAVLAHHLLHVGPHGVGALGQHPVTLVEHLVEDLHALVGQPDLVGVGIHQRPPDVDRLPVLEGRVELATDVLDRLGDRRQTRLEQGEDARGHGGRPHSALAGDWLGGRTTQRTPSGTGRRNPSAPPGSPRVEVRPRLDPAETYAGGAWSAPASARSSRALRATDSASWA